MGKTEIDVTMQKRGNIKWVRAVPGLVISLVALGLLFHYSDLSQIKNALYMANYYLAISAGLITILWLIVRSMVWRTLLKERATFGQVFFTLNEGYLLNNFLPFRLGELGRAFLLAQKAKINFWQTLSSIFIERALDMALATGLLLGSLFFVIGADWAIPAALGAAGVVCLVFGVFFLMARNRAMAEQLFTKITGRMPWFSRIGSKSLLAFLEGLSVLTSGRRFLLAVAWMVLNWIVGIGQYYLFLLAFFPDAKPLWACFSLGVAALGVAAPSSPGGLGVLELSLVGALAMFHLSTSTSLAFAITLHLFQYLITGCLGAYALFRDGESIIGLYQRIRHLQIHG